jgi:hypothetical protein
MHRFRLFSSLVGLSLSFGIAACGDDGGGGVPPVPDAAPGADAPGPTVDAAPTDGGNDPTVDAAPGVDGAVPPDAGPVPTTAVVINEVVLAPQQDWGSTSNGNIPFDGTPGTGTVSSRDQYIEILNTGTTPVSLIGWRIEITDSSDGAEVTPLAPNMEAGIELVFSVGSTQAALLPGGFAVLGNPNGTVGLDAYIVLKDNRGVVVDDVEIGDENENDAEDGAPAAGQNGFARGAFEEAVGRPEDQADTDNDRADFDKMYATPLGPNRPPPTQAENTPPTVAAPQGTTNWPVNQFVRAVFNERLQAAALISSDVTITVNGNARSVERLTFTDGDKILIAETAGVLPFGASVTLTLRTTIRDYNGNPLAAQQQISFTTEAAPANNGNIILNELCIDAQQDWDHSSGGGSPFGQTPGPDATDVSSSDEWIELLVSPNVANAVDLSGYRLEVFNGPNIDGPAVLVTVFDDTKVADGELKFFGGGQLTGVPASARVVVGDPTGSISNDAYIVLRDASGTIVDEVEVGGNTGATDRGGDGNNNGAPDAGLNGNSTGQADETVSRRRDANGAIDTGNDVSDWVHQAATLGQPNPT